MRTRSWIAVLGWCCCTTTVVAQDVPDFDLPRLVERGEMVEDLRQFRIRAKQDGLVPVIVRLRMKSRPDALLSLADQVAQRDRIAAMQTRLVTELEGVAGVGGQIKRYRYSPFIALSVTPAALERLAESDRVTAIEEDIAVPLALTQSVPLIGADRAAAAGYTGSGWAVAVLDSGVQRDHPALNGRVVEEACFSGVDGQSQSVCPGGARSLVGPGAAAPCTVSDGCAHGTHVAGIAAGAGAEIGVARAASIIAVQVFSRLNNCVPSASENCIRTYLSDWKAGLEYVYSLRERYAIAAANMSIGGGRWTSDCDAYSDVRAAYAAIDNLSAAKIATVVATGNDGYTDGIGFPACLSNSIRVGSVLDSAGLDNSCRGNYGGPSVVNAVRCSSNSASMVDLLAPGHLIRSSIPGSTYAEMGGTSMAAPHVAGCWAVLRQGKPSASVDELKQALAVTGVAVTDWRNGLVRPRIDCKAALDRINAAAAPRAIPDLTASVVGVWPTAVASGDEVKLSAEVRNAGTAASAASTLRYYLSSDALIARSDTALACVAPVPVLAAAATASAPLCSFRLTTAGAYYLGVCVDAVNGETDTANNCSIGSPLTVTGAGQPDLLIASISAAAQASIGGSLQVAATVRNRGSGRAASAKLKVVLSSNATISTADQVIGSCDLIALDPEASDGCAGDVTVPTTVTPGTYYVGAIVDPDQTVAESNETNNTAIAANSTVISGGGALAALGDAVEASSLTWTSGGDAPWVGQSAVARSGGDAAKSGLIGHDQASYMQTTVVGPGTLSFYWKVSSEADYDFLAVLIDNQLTDYISGEKDWAQVSLTIPAGSHTVTWVYVKDESVSAGQDAGYVDSVSFVAGGSSLEVRRLGGGEGRILTLGGGIDCGADCAEVYAVGARVTLVARPASGYQFFGWTGACSGVADCELTLDASKSVNGWFGRASDGFPPTAMPSGWVLAPTSSDAPWASSSTHARGGLSSLKSGAIGDGKVSGMGFTGIFRDGVVRFARKVSSEEGYDFYGFAIDGTVLDYDSGEVDWREVSFPITAGEHTLIWLYTKDESDRAGQDAAWVDGVRLPLASSAGVLGTPANGSTVSGVGVISGYHCSSQNIEIRIDGVSLGRAGAGTTLLGTLPVCGQPETGYSLLYNFNNLADGSHTIAAYADGNLIGSNVVTTVKSGGTAWLSGVSRSVQVSDFPRSGQTATLDWIQSYQNFLVTNISGVAASTLTAAAGSAPPVATVGVLGTPAEGSVVSGVGVISGYHCTSKNIEVYIDGVPIGKAGAGTTLMGTQGVCGRTDTGYSLLYNFNNLTNGQHTIAVYADGSLLETNTVTTFQSGGTAWLSGASRTQLVADFPQTGRQTTLSWTESYQNFLVTALSP